MQQIDSAPVLHPCRLPGAVLHRRRSGDEPVPDALIQALRCAHGKGARILSICSGVFVLAAAGLLTRS